MSENTADVFTAPAHPARSQILQILQDLREGERSAAGLVAEHRDANRILHSLAGERLALSVGNFLSATCPEQMLLRGLRHRAPAAANPAEAPREASLES